MAYIVKKLCLIVNQSMFHGILLILDLVIGVGASQSKLVTLSLWDDRIQVSYLH